MARTKQTARRSSGGRAIAPEDRLGHKAARVLASMRRARTRKWKVRYLADCRESIDGVVEYEVVWWSRKNNAYERTWEPKIELIADGMTVYIELVDRWISNGRENTFDFFMHCDSKGKKISTSFDASECGMCTFIAVRNACEHIDIPFSTKVLDDFLKEGKSKPRDPCMGMTWKMLRAFCKMQNKSGSCIDVTTLDLNHHKSSHRGISAIKRLALQDGYYLVGAATPINVGHCVVLHVKGKLLKIIDDEQVLPLSRCDWIDTLHFVRKFQVYTKK